jgi:hypothetical protein
MNAETVQELQSDGYFDLLSIWGSELTRVIQLKADNIIYLNLFYFISPHDRDPKFHPIFPGPRTDM